MMKAGAEGWSFGYNHHLIEHQGKKSLPLINHLPRAEEKQNGGLRIETSLSSVSTCVHMAPAHSRTHRRNRLFLQFVSCRILFIHLESEIVQVLLFCSKPVVNSPQLLPFSFDYIK